MEKITLSKKEFYIRNSKSKLFLAFLFVPVAYISQFWHELGHWFHGEISGTNMLLGFIFLMPSSGKLVSETSELITYIGDRCLQSLYHYVLGLL
jgi:hypothetical protein